MKTGAERKKRRAERKRRARGGSICEMIKNILARRGVQPWKVPSYTDEGTVVKFKSVPC